jgi:signal transduction histidine kinase
MNTLKVAVLAVVVIFFGLSTNSGTAAEFGTAAEAKALVEKAAAFWHENGRDKALAAFNDRNGAFVDRDLYVVAANLSDGVRIAHGFNSRMIGKSLADFKDIEGKAYGLEILDLARTAGSGWVDYKFTNPVTRKIMDKTSYVLKVDDVVIFSGAYK